MSNGRLAGRGAVVSGGQDIGRAGVRHFAAEGAEELVAELDEAAGPEAVAEFAAWTPDLDDAP